MTRAVLGVLLFTWILGVGLAVPAHLSSQQARREVRIASEAIGAADFEVLRAALSRLEIPLQRAVGAAPDCTGNRPAEVTVVSVWISWQPGARMNLCFEDGAGRHARALGPFETLDASAREQLITVIESGLEAAQSTMPGERATPPTAAQTPSAPRPAPEPRQPDSSPARSDDTGLEVAVGIGLSTYAENVSATWLSASFEYALYRRTSYLAFELDYAPPFSARVKALDLGLQGQCLRVGVAPVASFELFDWLRLSVALGPALEWCALTPLASSQWRLSEIRATAHVDPLLFARAGPVFALGQVLTLSVQAGPELLLRQRSYGFSATDQVVTVLSFHRVRFTVLAQIGVRL